VHRTAADGILSYAAEHDTPLIVMGTHGRRGVRRLLLGSVAEEVVRRAPGPVVTVGRGAESSGAPTGGRLLVPIDLSGHQWRLLAHARAWAQAFDLSLTLLHVLHLDDPPAPYPPRSETPDADTLRARAEEALNEAAASVRDAGLAVDVATRSGHPAEEILAAVDEHDASLLAVATHGRTGLERVLMGSVAEAVIRQAPCPVLTVKSFGRSLVGEVEA
jgi:nucleotide-binding universal stress UspA family protein